MALISNHTEAYITVILLHTSTYNVDAYFLRVIIQLILFRESSYNNITVGTWCT